MKTLRKINWTNELSIGNSNIDQDHKKLLNVYNDLVDLVELKKNREELAFILTKLTDYVLSHFKKEETYMQDFAYPKLAEHKQDHKNYIYKVSMFNIDLLGSTPPDPRDIIKFIELWLTEHIIKMDVDYENYKNKMQLQATYEVSHP